MSRLCERDLDRGLIDFERGLLLRVSRRGDLEIPRESLYRGLFDRRGLLFERFGGGE